MMRAVFRESFRAAPRSKFRVTAWVWPAVVMAGAFMLSGSLNLLDLRPSEDTGGHEDQDDGEDRERGHVLVLDRKIGRPEGLDEADDQPAQNRSRQRAD